MEVHEYNRILEEWEEKEEGQEQPKVPVSAYVYK